MNNKIVLFSIFCISVLNLFSQTVTDIEGNIYNTVTIGNQVWMASNLKTSKYNNGINILKVTSNSVWQSNTTGAYSYYNNDSVSYASAYGKLYNWFAVTNSNNLCPSGWRVPTKDDWSALINFVGGVSVAGGILKEKGTAHWVVPNTDATNDFGFTALPGGFRHVTGGSQSITSYGWWWSTTHESGNFAWNVKMFYNSGSILTYTSEKQGGFSIRCVKDTLINESLELENLNDIRVYPNPASDILMIEAALGAEINIINSVGKKILDLQSKTSNNAIDLSKLPAGFYSVVIRTKNGIFNKKIIKLN